MRPTGRTWSSFQNREGERGLERGLRAEVRRLAGLCQGRLSTHVLWYLSSRPFLVKFALAAANQSRSQKQRSFPGEGDSDSRPERQRWGAGGRNPSGSFTATSREHRLKRFGQKEELKHTLQQNNNQKSLTSSFQLKTVFFHGNKNHWPTNFPHCYVFHETKRLITVSMRLQIYKALHFLLVLYLKASSRWKGVTVLCKWEH